MADVVCVGCSCADVLILGADFSKRPAGEAWRCKATMLAVGGDAANEAIVLGRLGVDVKLLTGVGADSIGTFVEETARKANVDVSAIRHVEGCDTTMNVIVVHPDGDRNFCGTGKFPESMNAQPDLEQLSGAKIISIASMLIPPFLTPESVLRVAKRAKENGSIVCADVIYTEACKLEDLREALQYVDYIFPNFDEARELTGKDDLDEMADVFLGYGVKNVIIKTGKKGCFVKNAHVRLNMPCIGPKSIDTTGAGDNFAAGFIAALNDGKNLEDCCTYAAATAGLACQYLGANSGVQCREQVEQFLKDYDPRKEKQA